VNFDLTDGHFKRLHTLSEGDTLTYKTALGKRSYTVSAVREIAADDWSYLGRTDDNRITMITCISGKSDVRLMVQAVSAK
jgi:LPXTG-site transpeptidase (sortase) family protein